MKKKKIAIITVAAVTTAFLLTSFNQPHDTEASVLVHDDQNIAEAIKSAVNTAQTVINTAEQVKIGMRNLASLNADKLLAQYAGVNDQIKDIVKAYDDYRGILSSEKNMEQKWNEAFGSVDDIFNGTIDVGDYWANQQNSLKHLSETYYDVAKTASNTAQSTQERQEQLLDAINNASNADGIKSAIQAGNQINAINAADMIENNNLMAQGIATMAAKNQKEAQQEAAGMKMNQDAIDDAKAYLNTLTIENKPVKLPENW